MAPGARVTGGVEIGQADVVGVTVHAIYHRVGGGVELIIEATSDQPSDDRRRVFPLIEDVVADAPFDVLLGERRGGCAL